MEWRVDPQGVGGKLDELFAIGLALTDEND
jgi:hypothetical protein